MTPCKPSGPRGPDLAQGPLSWAQGWAEALQFRVAHSKPSTPSTYGASGHWVTEVSESQLPGGLHPEGRCGSA